MSNGFIPVPVLSGTSGPQDGEISLSWTVALGASTPITWYGFIFTVRNMTTNAPVIVSAITNTSQRNLLLTMDVNGQPLTPGHTYSISMYIRLNSGPEGNESNTVSVYAPLYPAVPHSLQALAGPGVGEITLSWTMPNVLGGGNMIGSTPTNYIINVMPVGGTAFNITTPNAQTSISLSSAQLTPGTTYTFTVSAFAVIQGTASSPIEQTSPLAPNTPTNVIATPGAQVNCVTLTWDFVPITGAPITGFQIKITAAGLPDVLHDINTVLSRIVTLGQGNVTLNPAVSYVFYVKAKGVYVNSAFSIGAAATPPSANQFPNTPTNVIATSGPDFGQVSLTWDISEITTAPISGYTIIISTLGASPRTINTNTNATSKVLTTTDGLSAGTLYNFVVYPITSLGYTAAGSSSTPGTAAAVSIPYNVSATSGPAIGGVTLTWSISGNIVNIVGYTIVIYNATTNVEIPASPLVLDNTARTKVLNGSNGLIAGINYRFGVKANSLTASGPISSYVTAIALAGRTVPCYVKGTMILTDKGYIKIEDIKKGDKVVREGCISKRGVLEKNKIKEVPVTWVNKFKIETLDSLSRPICIAKNAFGEDRPFENLYVSPGHSIIIDDRLSTAKNLRNGETIYPYDEFESVEYYHVQCETHSAIYANGILSETYVEWRKEFFNEIDYLK